MKYTGVYDAIYQYLKKVIEEANIEDERFDKTINIEVMNIENQSGILIQKIGSQPVETEYITGEKTLIFKFTVKSIQEYIASDDDNKLQIIQSLDGLGDYIEKVYKNGQVPDLSNEYICKEFELLNTASAIEITENRITAGIDLQFNYISKRR